MIVTTKQNQIYIEKLLEDLGFKGAPKAEKVKALELLGDRFERVALLTLTGMLNDKQKEQLSDMLDEPDAEDKVAVLAAGVPGFDVALQQALAEEYEGVKSAMLGP